MDIQRMHEFNTLVEYGSFREAAKVLGISPSLLSNHINLLEKRVGVSLLKRNAHSIMLTEAGKRFLIDSKEFTQEYSQIVSGLDSISESGGMGIRIGFSGFTIPSKLGPFLDTVNLRYPNIKLEFFDDRVHNIENSVAEGKIDLFFTYAESGASYENIEKEAVYSTKVLALVPLHHHLAHKSSLSVSDLEGERFVLYPKGADSSYYDSELSILKRSGISFSLYEGDVCPTAHFIMVPVGKGLALCPRVMRGMIPPNTTALPVIDPNFETTMYMFYRKDNPNPYLGEFLESFRSFGAGGGNDN